jgi:hypothetical protein
MVDVDVETFFYYHILIRIIHVYAGILREKWKSVFVIEEHGWNMEYTCKSGGRRGIHLSEMSACKFRNI